MLDVGSEASTGRTLPSRTFTRLSPLRSIVEARWNPKASLFGKSYVKEKLFSVEGKVGLAES